MDIQILMQNMIHSYVIILFISRFRLFRILNFAD